MSVSQALVGLLVAGLGVMILVKLHEPVLGLFLLLVALGFCGSGLLVAFPYLLLSQTPPDMVGRVSAFAGVVPTGMQLAGPVVGAAIITASGVGWVFGIAGAALAVLGVTVTALPLSGCRPAAAPEPDATEAAPVLALEPSQIPADGAADAD
jgi:MFS family permease